MFFLILSDSHDRSKIHQKSYRSRVKCRHVRCSLFPIRLYLYLVFDHKLLGWRSCFLTQHPTVVDLNCSIMRTRVPGEDCFKNTCNYLDVELQEIMDCFLLVTRSIIYFQSEIWIPFFIIIWWLSRWKIYIFFFYLAKVAFSASMT